MAVVPVITSYNPPTGRLLSRSLQNFIIGSHSSFDAGIPSFEPFFTSTKWLKPFLNAETSDAFNALSAGGARWNNSKGVGHSIDSVGYDIKGPLTLTTVSSGRTAYPASLRCFSSSARHQRSATSAATVPPCAKPKRWTRLGSQRHSLVRCARTLSRRSSAGVGSGCSINSPSWSNESYHWNACSYRNGILEMPQPEFTVQCSMHSLLGRTKGESRGLRELQRTSELAKGYMCIACRFLSAPSRVSVRNTHPAHVRVSVGSRLSRHRLECM